MGQSPVDSGSGSIIDDPTPFDRGLFVTSGTCRIRDLSTSTRADTLPAKIVLMGCLVDPIDVIRWSVSGALGGIVHAVFVHVEPRN